MAFTIRPMRNRLINATTPIQYTLDPLDNLLVACDEYTTAVENDDLNLAEAIKWSEIIREEVHKLRIEAAKETAE